MKLIFALTLILKVPCNLASQVSELPYLLPSVLFAFANLGRHMLSRDRCPASRIRMNNAKKLANTPPYTPVQEGRICVLSVSQGCIITAKEREVEILPWENDKTQKWKIEMKDRCYGFRNLQNGNLLGFHFFGNVVAGESKLNNWELFVLDRMDGGYRFMTPSYWIWSEGYIVRRSLSTRLENSSDRGYYSPIEIEYVHD